MMTTMTTVRLDTRLVDEAVQILGAKSRAETEHAALREIVALNKFTKLMSKNAGKLNFEGLQEY